MKYLSLFTGIGGFELGIQQAYESLCHADRGANRGGKENKTRDEGSGLLPEERKNSDSSKRSVSASPPDGTHERPLCIGYSEIDKYAVKIYEKHFKHHNYGDITKIDATALPDFDFLCGGFPCQAFSIAGKRKGFDDTRGTLFFEIARILHAKQPRLLLLENVKGLLSHDGGRTFKTIIYTLTELGYDVQWQVLNSKDFGVPQNRERVFIVGHLRGTPRPEVFPLAGQGNENTTVGKSTETAVARTLTGGGHTGGNHSGMTIIGTLRTHKDGEGFREVQSGLAPTLPARAREDGSGQGGGMP